MKKIISITGANGFVGRHLEEKLRQKGHELVLFNRPQIQIEKEVPDFSGTEYVVHLAARTFVPDSWKHSTDFFACNVKGTENVLKGARLAGLPVIFLSSYVYGWPLYLPIDEEHRTQALNPYMHSKILAEDLCLSYRDNFGMKICILRPFNIYGPGQALNFLIPKIYDQATDPSVNEILLNGLTPKRDYLHVWDLVEAIAKVIEQPCNTTLNIASGRSHTVIEVAEMILKIVHVQKPIRTSGDSRLNEIEDTKASIQKAWEFLKWQPQYTIETGLATLKIL